MINGTVLIIDDNKSVIDSLEMMLGYEVQKVLSIRDPGRVYDVLRRNAVDIVLLDMNFRAGISSGNEGLFWLKEIMKHDRDISVIMITAYGDIELAVKAIREGAFDFVLKPWDNNKLIATINAAWKLRTTKLKATLLEDDNRALKKEINRASGTLITGPSPSMKSVMGMVKKVSVTDANVLICGENGTGKELIAREIHNLSLRNIELIVPVDLGAIPETLFESEMFGHTKGAFTDAREDRPGKIEMANRGTLFLDEIGNLSLSSQSKLLNALQSRCITRVGSNRPIQVDLRLISATNCDLASMVSKGLFREDLLYRINTILIKIPPLRERIGDLPDLVKHFLTSYSEKYHKELPKITQQAIDKLSAYSWPGNIRELQHTIEKTVILSDSPVLKPSDFEFSNVARIGETGSNISLSEMEMRMITDSMHKNNNNLSAVAAQLGITRQTLYNKIKKYDL
ncbi:MAG TPA: sigma-54 dependent transcriptional regulator [Bacteroidales bacterium]|nr:sigma-54 dependent transcriptional regulator [Bacteroidales bacterium]